MTNQNAALRRQMIGSLTEDDLRGLCFDYFPNIYAELTTGMTMSRMVELLLQWCVRNGRFQDLRVALHQINPHVFPQMDLVDFEKDQQIPIQMAFAEQFTAAITPPFARSRIPITKIEIEVRHIQEKMYGLLTPLWLFVSLSLIVFLVLIVVLITLPLPNITQLSLAQGFGDRPASVEQSQPIQPLTASQQVTDPLQMVTESDQPPQNPKLGTTWLRPQDNMQMVFVPVSQNYLDSASTNNDTPFATSRLQFGFWIDQTEVSNQQYDQCVAAGHCDVSALADIADYHKPTYPVVGVSWFDALAYCEWVDAQLPTNLQWDHAVSGFENSPYPWGEAEPTCDLAQYNDCQIGLMPVGSKPDGQSWAGAYDLAGNVWEWVQADVGETAVAQPHNPVKPNSQPLRGGGWNADSSQLLNSIRKNENPHNWLDHLGFRCVYSDLSP